VYGGSGFFELIRLKRLGDENQKFKLVADLKR
jgi:hypothetical protein